MGRRRAAKEHSATLAVPSRGGGEDSDASEVESVAYSSVAGSVDDDLLGEVDVLVDAFAENVEHAQDKRIPTRLKALNAICTTLKRHCLPELVGKWRLTLGEIAERNLKRSHEESTFAYAIAALLCLQLGTEAEADLQPLLAAMRAMAADPAIVEPLRAAAAQTLGLCVYVGCSQLPAQYEAVQALRSTWTSVKCNSEQHTLFAAALSAWVLLLGRLDGHLVSAAIGEWQPKLCNNYLESPSVEIRLAASEALAGLHELGVRLDGHFRFKNSAHLETLLESLALDSSKHRAKRDKKAQKFTIRQVNDAIFHDKAPQSRVRFNKYETLRLDGCHQKLLYESLCQLLKGDFNRQLTHNEVLRELFELGPPVQQAMGASLGREGKLERMNQLAAVDKARNIHRAKQRDKKAL